VPDAALDLSRPLRSCWTSTAPSPAAIEFLLERPGIGPALVAGAGDGGNDAIGMHRIGAPVAMGNAPEGRAPARAVIGRHDEEGAAEFLEEILRQVSDRVARRMV
jgi:hypothetical protein